MSFHNYILISKETNLIEQSYCNGTEEGWKKQFVIMEAVIITIFVKPQEADIYNAVFFFQNCTIDHAFLQTFPVLTRLVFLFLLLFPRNGLQLQLIFFFHKKIACFISKQ